MLVFITSQHLAFAKHKLLKAEEKDGKEADEATASPAAANEISIAASMAAVS